MEIKVTKKGNKMAEYKKQSDISPIINKTKKVEF